MEWQYSNSSSSSSSESIPRPKKLRIDDLPVFIQQSASILQDFFSKHPLPSRPPLSASERTELDRLLHKSMGNHDVQKVLGWHFGDHTLLLQAVTHASYVKNRLTECYQRLEFLGDAVLDYLVTCHIYSTFPSFGPGEISSMRSALVNNSTFAELAVDLKLHSALLYGSPMLCNLIDRYLRMAEACEGEGSGEFIIVRGEGSSGGEGEASSSGAGGIADQKEEEVEEVEYLDPPKVLGDILESLAGAIFVDSKMSLDAVWQIFQPLFKKKIDSFKGKIPIGPIQELFNLELSPQVEKKKEGSKRVRYTISVQHQGKSLRVVAIASTIKAAKTAASREILKKINK